MANTRQLLTADQIYKIWRQRTQLEEKYSDIADELDIPYHSVAGTDKRLKRYMYKRDTIKAANGQYVEAADQALEYLKMMETNKEDLRPKRTFDEAPMAIVDHYEELDEALETFKQAIEEFVEYEVDTRVGIIQDENTELQQKVLEQESALSAMQNQAQKSNWSDTLRKKFNK